MNIKQHKFVTEYLRMGDKIVAYHNAYPNPNRKDRATESAANRLMQHPEVLKAITDAQETCMYRAMEDLKDKMKEELLTVYQKRLLCKHVVLGEVREEVVFKGKGCAHCSYFREIPYSVKLRYSKEDSLLAGHYPTKRAKKHNPPIETCNISQQPNEQIPPLKEVPDSRRAEDVHSQETNEIQETCNISQQIPPLKEVPDSRRAEDVHSHGTNEIQENETRNISQQPNEVSSTSQPDNTSPLGRGVGAVSASGVMGSRDEPTHTTNQPPEKEPQRLSVSAVKKETQETRNISQQPDNTSPLGRGVGAVSASGVMGSRDEPTHTTNQPQEKEPQRLSVSAVKQPRTISHAGLRKLLNKQRIKKQQPLIFTPCA